MYHEKIRVVYNERVVPAKLQAHHHAMPISKATAVSVSIIYTATCCENRLFNQNIA
jgi:hypothetical protein